MNQEELARTVCIVAIAALIIDIVKLDSGRVLKFEQYGSTELEKFVDSLEKYT